MYWEKPQAFVSVTLPSHVAFLNGPVTCGQPKVQRKVARRAATTRSGRDATVAEQRPEDVQGTVEAPSDNNLAHVLQDKV